jgi:hypothetical protein
MCPIAIRRLHFHANTGRWGLPPEGTACGTYGKHFSLDERQDFAGFCLCAARRQVEFFLLSGIFPARPHAAKANR